MNISLCYDHFHDVYLYELGLVYYLVYSFDFSDIDAVVSQWIIYMSIAEMIKLLSGVWRLASGVWRLASGVCV
jgi:hypothetical protein